MPTVTAPQPLSLSLWRLRRAIVPVIVALALVIGLTVSAAGRADAAAIHRQWWGVHIVYTRAETIAIANGLTALAVGAAFVASGGSAAAVVARAGGWVSSVASVAVAVGRCLYIDVGLWTWFGWAPCP